MSRLSADDLLILCDLFRIRLIANKSANPVDLDSGPSNLFIDAYVDQLMVEEDLG
jgi:hypothetical protein